MAVEDQAGIGLVDSAATEVEGGSSRGADRGSVSEDGRVAGRNRTSENGAGVTPEFERAAIGGGKDTGIRGAIKIHGRGGAVQEERFAWHVRLDAGVVRE